MKKVLDSCAFLVVYLGMLERW